MDPNNFFEKRFKPFAVKSNDSNSMMSLKSLGHFKPYWGPSDHCGPNFHMCEWWRMGLHHNRNRFRRFAVKSEDSNWINSPNSQFWDISGHIGHLLGTFWTQFPLCEWWPMVLNHNRNRFIPFTVKSNDPNSINSPKSHICDIFSHIGHLLTLVGPISTCVNGGQWYSIIIGTVLDHLQSNQMIQIRSIVEKTDFCFK